MKILGFRQIVHETQMIKGELVGRATILHTFREDGVIIYSSTFFDDACAHAID